MGYELNVLFGKTVTLSTIEFPHKGLKLTSLNQGFSLLPFPIYDYGEGDYEGFSRIYFEHDEDIHMLKRGLIPVQIYESILKRSSRSKIAFLYADIFGGVGEQYAIIWENGEILKEFIPQSNTNTDSWNEMPINQALRLFGVVTEENYDEFDTMRLGRFRDTYNWYIHSLGNKD